MSKIVYIGHPKHHHPQQTWHLTPANLSLFCSKMATPVTGGHPNTCQLLYYQKTLFHHQSHPPQAAWWASSQAFTPTQKDLVQKVTSGAVDTATKLKKLPNLDMYIQTIRIKSKREWLKPCTIRDPPQTLPYLWLAAQTLASSMPKASHLTPTC